MFYRAPVWSPVEVDYLKQHKNSPISQLTIALAKSRSAVQRKIAELEGKPIKKNKKNKKSYIGKRKDLGNQFFRSSWEANVARWFKHNKREWIFEPKVFFFKGIKRGTVSYLPDFYLPKEDIWVEVKGQLLPKDRAAIRRFKKYYPDEFKKLRYISGRKNTKATEFFESMGIPCMIYYNELNKEFKDKIKHWE